MPFPMICTYCSSNYFVTKIKQQNTSKYCSRKCHYDAKARLVKIGDEVQKFCAKCGQVKPFSEYHKATRSQTGARAECKSCQHKYTQVYVKENAEHRNKLTRKWRANNPDKVKAMGKRTCQKIRNEVLMAYGHKCNCCGVTNQEFLAIDHVFNDGNLERQERGTSATFYRFLKKQGFPKDRYQILCHNCNMAKAFYGECPHKHK